jgi:hypothetical protein
MFGASRRLLERNLFRHLDTLAAENGFSAR